MEPEKKTGSTATVWAVYATTRQSPPTKVDLGIFRTELGAQLCATDPTLQLLYNDFEIVDFERPLDALASDEEFGVYNHTYDKMEFGLTGDYSRPPPDFDDVSVNVNS